MNPKETLLYSLLQRHAEGLDAQLEKDQDVPMAFTIVAFSMEEKPKISYVTNAEPHTLSVALRELADIIEEQGHPGVQPPTQQ